MAGKFFIPGVFVLFLLFAGCSTGSDYWKNRLDDAGDTITLTVGSGFGVKFFLFGIQSDSFYNYAPFLGIMGGEVIKSASHSSNFHISEGNFGIPLPCVSAEIFYPNENAARRGKAYCGGSLLFPFFLRDPAGVSKFLCNSCSQKSKFVKERAWSEYCMNTPEKQRISRREFLKGLNINWEGAEYGGPWKLENYGRISWSIYSDIHIVCALGAGFRIGINPGEIADFILGWCMIDIFHDDL